MKNIIKTSYLLVLFVFMSLLSCETTELDLRSNPNALPADKGNADFLLSNIQLQFKSVVESFGATGAELTRIDYMFGRSYINVYSPSNFDGRWTASYTEIMSDINALMPLAEERDLKFHIGMSQFIKAYTITTLVDYFGDVPYLEANLGADNFNPGVDKGQAIYEASFALLDKAIENFTDGGKAKPSVDFFYGGNTDSWIAAANTLKIKMLMTTRLVDASASSKINSIIASGKYIKTYTKDLQFNYGNQEVQPDTRHPRYSTNYQNSGSDDYMSNHQMFYMLTNQDPRMRYYYYRQNRLTPGTDTDPNLETLQCSLQAAPDHLQGYPFCNLSNGYWGRDHGNNEGIPPDGFLKTIAGVYPAGGAFDDDTFKGKKNGAGGKGAGITPMLLASSVKFWQAELAMESGDKTAAKNFMSEAIKISIDKTLSFGSLDTSADVTNFAPTTEKIDNFITAANIRFDADSKDGWNVLAQEFFTSVYGNGSDAYNFYRRTGYPTNLQPSTEPNPGSFVRSVFYPSNFVNNNSSVTQKSDVTVQVFWDTNPSSPAFPSSN